MNTQQAYIEGFVKRAAEYGFSEEESMDLLKSASTRAMREFREGTPAGEEVEALLRKMMGEGGLTEDNIAMLKNNPRGIDFGSEGKLTPKLREALKAHTSDIPADHIRTLSKAYYKGTEPGVSSPKFPGIFGKANIDRTSGNIVSGFRDTPEQLIQDKINYLSSKAKERFNAGKADVAGNIERANIDNFLARSSRKLRAPQTKAIESEIKSTLNSGLINKLKGILGKGK